MAYKTTNPFNGATTATFPELDGVALEARLAQAATCFAHWKTESFAERAAVLSRAAAILQAAIILAVAAVLLIALFLLVVVRLLALAMFTAGN